MQKLILERLEINDSEVNRFGIGCSKKIAKKSGKLSKSQKLAKLRKKLSKSENLLNFGAMEAGPKFLTPDTKTAFNHLWLAFIKAPIL